MYKIIGFCFGMLFSILFIFVGRAFRIMHWPYGELIYFSGWALCIAMIALFVYGMIKKGESNYKIILFCLSILFIVTGRTLRIMHWPYGKPIYFSGLALCIIMTALLVYGMFKKKSSNEN